MKEKLVRISKIISHSGICSRRDAEELIKKGKVKINGAIFKDFYIEINSIKNVEVNKRILRKQITKLWCFYKPRGYVSSNKEQKNQISFFNLIPKNILRVVSVGRLDIQSEGLILLTNNPSLSSFLEKPSNEIKRKYIIKVTGKLPKQFEMISKKSLIIDGIIYKRLKLIIKKEYKNHSQLEITLREGKNREIRKIMNYFKLKVQELKRISFGPFELGSLKTGELKIVENNKLDKYLKLIGFVDENHFW